MVPALRKRSPARAGATILIVVIIGMQLWAMVAYRDDWPFASNSMFSFRREPSEHVYDLRLEVLAPEGWRRLDADGDLGVPPESFRRLLLSRWYGSTDSQFPQRSFSRDDRARFSARLTELCLHVDTTMRERGRPVAALQLSVVELERQAGSWVELSVETVGSCNPITTAFEPAVISA